MVGAIGCTNLLTTAARGPAAAQSDRTGIIDELDPAAVVDAKLAQARIHAAVPIVHTADDMLGSLIDAVARASSGVQRPGPRFGTWRGA